MLRRPVESTLGAAISVKHKVIRHIAAQGVRHPQRPVHETGVLTLVHRPTQHAPGVPVTGGGEVEPALAGRQIRDVADPDRIKTSLIPLPLSMIREAAAEGSWIVVTGVNKLGLMPSSP